MADKHTGWLAYLGGAILVAAFALWLLVTTGAPPSAGVAFYWPWWVIELTLMAIGIGCVYVDARRHG